MRFKCPFIWEISFLNKFLIYISLYLLYTIHFIDINKCKIKNKLQRIAFYFVRCLSLRSVRRELNISNSMTWASKWKRASKQFGVSLSNQFLRLRVCVCDRFECRHQIWALLNASWWLLWDPKRVPIDSAGRFLRSIKGILPSRASSLAVPAVFIIASVHSACCSVIGRGICPEDFRSSVSPIPRFGEGWLKQMGQAYWILLEG